MAIFCILLPSHSLLSRIFLQGDIEDNGGKVAAKAVVEKTDRADAN